MRTPRRDISPYRTVGLELPVEIRRARATPRATNLDWELESDRPVRRYVPAGRPHVPAASQYEEEAIDAGLPRRLMAVFIDGIILLGIDIAVVYFTMQICGVTMAEFDLVPKGPLVAFLVVQNIGYLIAFTAGGQTLGKMAAGIRVVAANPDEALDLGSATKRTAAWLVLAFPAGLGLLSALFSRDHRGLHDRFAGTRVVRAST